MIKKQKKIKVKTSAQLKKELDRVFSIWIRTKYSKGGMCFCYTCQRPFIVKDIQCGHFVSRSYLATRWDEENCRPQCIGCNIFGNGKPLDFEEHLKKEIGVKKVEAMKARRHLILKLSPTWYLGMIQKYKVSMV